VVPVGKVGQLIQDVETTGVAASVSGQYFDVGSIALTAGEWEIDWYVLMYNNGSSGFTEGIMGVSTATGNSSQDMVKGITQHDHYKTASVVSLSTSGSVRCRVSSTQITLLTTSTPSGTARTGNTLYLKAYANDITGGPPVAYGYIKATRA
jgi:hypothetical protein